MKLIVQNRIFLLKKKMSPMDSVHSKDYSPYVVYKPGNFLK